MPIGCEPACLRFRDLSKVLIPIDKYPLREQTS